MSGDDEAEGHKAPMPPAGAIVLPLSSLVTEDAYDDSARSLLRALHDQAPSIAHSFVDRFYQALARTPETRSILENLDSAEFARLRIQQAGHLSMLISPDLDASKHRARALHIGRIHARVGVDMVWLTDAYNLYQQALHDFLKLQPHPDGAATQRVLRLLDRRLLIDLQGQSAGYREVEQELARAMATVQQRVIMAGSTIDVYQGSLNALCDIEGILVGVAGREGSNGTVAVEAFAGQLAQDYLAAVQSGRVPPIRIRAQQGRPQGPSARAWSSGEPCISDAYAIDPATEPWRQLGEQFGIRSSAAIPLVDAVGQAYALLNLYSRWPGFFGTARMRAFLDHLQQVLSASVMRHSQGLVIPYHERKAYARLLESGRVALHYQPIVDLKTGRFVKAEALARLVGDDEALVSPGRFLPALGGHGLMQLFRFGLAQVCADTEVLQACGLDISVSLNLPPQATQDPAYRDILLRVIENCPHDPNRLELELLETDGISTAAARDPFFEKVRAMGIRLVQDDLGSGHSSLLRLDSMPFDEIKIDQGLVLHAAKRNPHRAFEFILHLTELVHALNAKVTVEGLENDGLIEAAAVLGVDHGQGYGLGRPMPLDALPAWAAQHRLDIDPNRPRTPWGALAGFLLWNRQLIALRRWPDLIEDFVRSPCLVQRYIDAHDLRDSVLQELVNTNHALAMQGGSGSLYQRSRRAIIKLLGDMGQQV